MDFVTVIIIAIGLSFDSFAVSLGCGTAQAGIGFKRAAGVASVLALFQGLLPLLGFYLGYMVSDYVRAVDHWIAFALLGFLGIRMISEGIKKREEKREEFALTGRRVISMAIGTSIDALAVGVSFAFLYNSIWFEALIIGVVTFIASMIAIRIGKSAGPRLGKNAEVAGGVLLIGIGIKILLEHTLLI